MLTVASHFANTCAVIKALEYMVQSVGTLITNWLVYLIILFKNKKIDFFTTLIYI